MVTKLCLNCLEMWTLDSAMECENEGCLELGCWYCGTCSASCCDDKKIREAIHMYKQLLRQYEDEQLNRRKNTK